MPAKKITVRKTSDFISFILDAERSAELTDEFIRMESAEKLYKFFQLKGYKGIPMGDCEDILKAKNNWDNLTHAGHGKPPCDGPKKGY
jgi:hypothetical protein